MTALAAPIAGRLRRPSWKDTRLVVGLLLVLLATALKSWDNGKATLVNLYTGDEEVREFDSLVTATTNVPEDALAKALEGSGIATHVIGDGVHARTAAMAIYEARELALKI